MAIVGAVDGVVTVAVIGGVGWLAAVVGYTAVGAAAIVAADMAGIVETGGTANGATVVGETAATEFADGGMAAAVSDCGVACVEGRTGGAGSAGVTPSAERATSELSVEAASFFHQARRCGTCAQRGPVWQPTAASAISATQTMRSDLGFMVNEPPESFARIAGRCEATDLRV